MGESNDYVAIAWTRPVNWLGFSALPHDIDAAAVHSKTIRYQRDMIRRWVKDDGGVLRHEEVIMELSPDRATPQVAHVIASLRKTFPTATLIAVDFPQANGWRPHKPLKSFMAHGPHVLIWPDPYEGDDFTFDPVAHFSAWDALHDSHRASKAHRREIILTALAPHAALSLTAKAAALNQQGLTTHTGKAWTKDNLAKFLASGAG